MIGRTTVTASAFLPDGIQVLWRDGNVVWVGPLNVPIEVDYDTLTLSPTDFNRLKADLPMGAT